MAMDRTKQERWEHERLSPFATKSDQSLGRAIQEQPCQFRTGFQRDRDRILHSKAFRRLKHKTQVFLSPEGDHYRTRLTHTLEVSQISRTIARALSLNEDLTEAIALGHDLGHTPFGHCGEMALNEIHKGGFCHNHQSLRVVTKLEQRSRGRKGLNLTKEVCDGILNHTGKTLPSTIEGQVVKICDRIAYINHDIDDAIRAKVLCVEEIPEIFLKTIGYVHSERINTLISDIILTSENQSKISMSPSLEKTFSKLREFMFERVYLNPQAKKEESKAKYILGALYKYFSEFPEKMPQEHYEDYKHIGHEAIKDYIAGMTDRYAVNRYKNVFIPQFWT